MNLEYDTLLYIIGHLTGSIVSLIMAVELWGIPKIKAKGYFLIVITSWLFIFIMYLVEGEDTDELD